MQMNAKQLSIHFTLVLILVYTSVGWNSLAWGDNHKAKKKTEATAKQKPETAAAPAAEAGKEPAAAPIPAANSNANNSDGVNQEDQRAKNLLLDKLPSLCSTIRSTGVKCPECSTESLSRLNTSTPLDSVRSTSSKIDICNDEASRKKQKDEKAETKCEDLQKKIDQARRDADKDCSESRVNVEVKSKKSKAKKDGAASAKSGDKDSKSNSEKSNAKEEEINSKFADEEESAEGCRKRAEECGEDAGEDIADPLQMVNIPGISNYVAKCPRYSSSDYKERSSTIRSEMRDLKKELETEQKDISSELAKKKKEISDIQKAIDELQPKLDEAMQKLEGEQMKLMAESHKMENEMNSAKAQIRLKLVEINANKIKLNSDKTTKLLEMSRTLEACVIGEEKRMNTDKFNSSIIRRSGGINSITDAKKSNNSQIQKYCYEKHQNDLKSFRDLYKINMDKEEFEYQMANDSLKQIEIQRAEAQKNQEKIMANLKGQIPKTAEAFMKQRKNLLLQMQIEMTALSQLEQSSRQKQYRLQADVNSSQRDLAALGTDPKGSKSDYPTARKSARDYAAALREYREFGNNKCTKLLIKDADESSSAEASK